MTEPTNAQKEAARQARNAYLRAWRRKNPDKVKAMHEKYWIKRAEREAAKLGDNKRKAETVSPVSTMEQALAEALTESGGEAQKERTVYAYLYPISETKPEEEEARA